MKRRCSVYGTQGKVKYQRGGGGIGRLGGEPVHNRRLTAVVQSKPGENRAGEAVLVTRKDSIKEGKGAAAKRGLEETTLPEKRGKTRRKNFKGFTGETCFEATGVAGGQRKCQKGINPRKKNTTRTEGKNLDLSIKRKTPTGGGK